MLRKELQAKLYAAGVLPTSQRMEVAELIFSKSQHLCAEQILEALYRRGSSVSKATVYNCLRIFSETGLVKEINVDGVRKIYDSTTQPHHHFLHVETGRLTDIPDDKVRILDLPPLPKGTEKDSVEVLIRVRNKS